MVTLTLAEGVCWTVSPWGNIQWQELTASFDQTEKKRKDVAVSITIFPLSPRPSLARCKMRVRPPLSQRWKCHPPMKLAGLQETDVQTWLPSRRELVWFCWKRLVAPRWLCRLKGKLAELLRGTSTRFVWILLAQLSTFSFPWKPWAFLLVQV